MAERVTDCRHPLRLPRFGGSPSNTGDAHATRISWLLVGQTVNDSIFGIELVGDAVEILRVPGLVSSKHGVGDVIGKLDDAGRARIHEERSVRQAPDDSPSGAENSKLN